MFTARLRTLPEFLQHMTSNVQVYEKIKIIEDALAVKHTDRKEFTVKGFSYPAQEGVDFQVDFLYSAMGKINWRERVICPVTSLNSRIRACIHFLEFELDIRSDSKVYIAEQLTPLYYYLHSRYTQITGSEYLGADIAPGIINDKGIRHENATNLSFADNELDYYLSFECFEHIPDFLQAFMESYRVLKKGGMLFWTIPFSEMNYENVIRATVSDYGLINHLLEPEYHGDPVNPDGGILCFTNFGWQLLDQLRTIGFRDVYAITFWSDSLGYYGKQFLFCARK